MRGWSDGGRGRVGCDEPGPGGRADQELANLKIAAARRFPSGPRTFVSTSGNRFRSDLSTLNSLGGDHPAHRGVGRSRAVGGRTAGRLRTASGLRTAARLAAAVAGIAARLAAAVAAAARLPALLRGVDRLQKVTDGGVLLPHAAAASSRTAARLAATGTSVAGRLAAAVAGVASGLSATVASVASRLAAAVAGVAGGLAAAIAAAALVLPLALLEQALQATEQVVLLPALAGTAAARTGVAATSTGVASRLAAAVAGVASGLRTSGAGTGVAARLTAPSTGVAAGLTARSTALVAEHPVKELETEGLATNGHAEDQRTEIHHTLQRATSPLLVNHRCARPARDALTPRL